MAFTREAGYGPAIIVSSVMVVWVLLCIWLADNPPKCPSLPWPTMFYHEDADLKRI